jgi:phospholipid transport system substrate-binding protein
MRSAIPALLVLSVSLTPVVASAQASDPAAAQIARFNAALLSSMKEGKALGYQGRYRKLEPVVKETFDLPIMMRFAVGPSWSTMSGSDQAALLAAFTRFSISTWAHNFDAYEGQSFRLGAVDSHGLDKLVHTQLVSGSGSPVELTYRMRQATGGQWKVIDVYFNGTISQLSQQKADFASTLQSGGPQALIQKISALSAKQAAGG